MLIFNHYTTNKEYAMAIKFIRLIHQNQSSFVLFQLNYNHIDIYAGVIKKDMKSNDLDAGLVFPVCEVELKDEFQDFQHFEFYDKSMTLKVYANHDKQELNQDMWLVQLQDYWLLTNDLEMFSVPIMQSVAVKVKCNERLFGLIAVNPSEQSKIDEIISDFERLFLYYL